MSGFWNLSCSGKKVMHQGVLSQYRYYLDFDSTSNFMLPNNFESKIWFKDSCVIYEVKMLTGVTNYTETGMERKEGFEFFKYSYLDLRTLRCQDYFHFSDTALPVSNYQLQKSEGINWKFYYEENQNDLAGTRSTLSDTLINGHLYKRVRLVNKGDRGAYTTTYYLEHHTKSNIFHINRALDNAYPDCQVVISEMKNDVNGPMKSVFRIEIVREKLTDRELKVFEKWQQNIETSKLPLLSLDEVNRIILPPAKY